MKQKVLWLEDGALSDLPEIVGPVIIDGRYDLVIAFDATEGVEHIMEAEFAAVIVDIRILPGGDRRWIDLHNAADKNKNAARLGLLVLRSLLRPEMSEVKLGRIPRWVRPAVFGVFTVENQNEVRKDLDELGITIYRQKTRRPSGMTLLELIEDIVEQARASGGD